MTMIVYLPLILCLLPTSIVYGQSDAKILKRSLSFVIDDTFSMLNDIEQVKMGANSIFDTVTNSNASQIENFLLVTFNDPKFELRVDTKNQSDFKAALNSIKVKNGGDCPEYALSGINLALERSHRGSYIFVFTDASAKDYKKYSEVKSLAIKMQSKVVFILTGVCGNDDVNDRPPDYKVYYDLAEVTLGQVFHMEKQEIGQILEYVKYIIKEDNNVILIETLPPGYNNTLNFTVDAKQKDVAISVSGDDPRVYIEGADGSKPKTKDLMKTSKVKITQLIGHVSGQFVAKLGSNSITDVVVTAISSFNFIHGFSSFTPSSLNDTTTRPVPDTKPYLSIQLLGDDNVKLQTVKIVDKNNNVINEMALDILNDTKKIYLTQPFQPPNTLFRISVIGYDTESKENITRMGPPVEPQSKNVPNIFKKPNITIEGGPKIKTTFNRPLQLKCKANGFPEPKIIWTEKDTGKVLSTNVSAIELGSDYINVLNIDRVEKNITYQCEAENNLGKNIENVSVESEFKIYFNVLKPPIGKLIKYNKEGNLTCEVDAYPPPTIKWLLNKHPISKDKNIDISDDGSILFIKKMQPQFAGNFICQVRNKYKAKKMEARLSIEGLVSPVINKNKTDYYLIKGSNETINCTIMEGVPKPNIKWYFKHYNDTKYHNINYSEESLNLTRVNFTQAGTYICKAINTIGEDKHKVNVSVVFAPTIEENEKIIVTKEGQVITLKCVVDGIPIPTVTWYKDDKEINNPDKNLTRIFEYNRLQINVTSKDTGTYVCTARNEIGTAKSITEVDVHVKPIIEKNISHINARRGSEVSINCTLIDGNPMVSIRWRFKSTQDKHFTDVKPTSNASLITIHNATVNHSGTYECIATNIIGNDKHEIDLFVEYPPIIQNDVDKINVKSGEYRLLFCNVDGIPIPKIEWLKDGVIINDDKRYKIYRDHSLSLQFSSQDGGNYTCTADNGVGTASKSTIVDVSVPVSIKVPEASTINSTLGDDNVILECQAEGHPKPDINWFFYSLDSNITKKNITPEASPSTLLLQSIELTHHGFYTCVASNNFSTSNITYELVVFTSPEIRNIPSKNAYNAVIGDLALRIPCDASGNPKPSITWMKGDFNVATGSDWYDIDLNGTLLIKNIDKTSEGTYSCRAENLIDFVEEFFEVTVDSFPEELSSLSKILIEEGTSASIECNVSHNKTDILRWYKDSNFIKNGELTIDNVTKADAGIYVCRVTNFLRSSSSSIQVEIGFKPEFTENMKTEEINIDLEGRQADLSCNAIGVPQPKVSWWHNDKEINATNGMVHVIQNKFIDEGKYYCNISNEFGSVLRTFVVKSKDCYLKIDRDFPVNQPLIRPSNWLKYDTVDGYLRIPQREYVSLHCPKFTRFSKSQITAFCVEDLNFKVSGKKYKYSDFKCIEEIKPVAHQTGIKCLPGSGNTEKISIGYNISGITDQVYEICLDKDKNVPIYSRYNIQHSLADVDLIKTKWLNSNLLPLDFDSLYDCQLQKTKMSKVLGQWFHRYDKCCFFKRQLVNPRDMLPGLAQKATFNHLNVVPQWSTCNNKNWDDMERKLRVLVKSVDYELIVWTGTSHHLSMAGITKSPHQMYITDKHNKQQPIPQFLWKVVQDPKRQASLAIIQVNVPDLTMSDIIRKYVLCPDICNDIAWLEFGMWHDITRGYVYCCTIQDFETAFEYSGIFEENYSNILNDET